MTDKELQILKEHIEQVIQKKVNGHITEMSMKLDAHMAETQPFLDGWRGAKILGNTLKWIAGVVIAVASAILIFKP